MSLRLCDSNVQRLLGEIGHPLLLYGLSANEIQNPQLEPYDPVPTQG